MKLIRYFIIFLNIIAALALIVAFITPMINPVRIPFLSFWGLIMPYIIILNIIFIIYWIIKARIYFLISLLTIIISWSTIKTSFPYHQTKEIETNNGLCVMSYNVRVFDRYNWSKNKENTSQLLSFIKKQYADIICIQEFGSSQQGNTERFILQSLGEYPYHYISYSQATRTAKHSDGLAILSKYPIISKGVGAESSLSKGYTIYADIKVDNNKYKIINAYFAPIKLTNKYDFIGHLDSENYKVRLSDAIKSVQEASKQHSRHAIEIEKIIKESDYPVILCADMNSTPVSFSYHQLTHQLEDTFLKYETGFGTTYNGKYPFLRIDYIFHSPQIPLISYERKKVNHSDHYPIMAIFSKKD